jgi:site-specific DNA-methyltransferase (adenine-specific)
MKRPLLEKGFDTLIRFNEAVSLIHKVAKFKEESFSKMVSSRKPFGFSTDFKGFKDKPFFLSHASSRAEKSVALILGRQS